METSQQDIDAGNNIDKDFLEKERIYQELGVAMAEEDRLWKAFTDQIHKNTEAGDEASKLHFAQHEEAHKKTVALLDKWLSYGRKEK